MYNKSSFTLDRSTPSTVSMLIVVLMFSVELTSYLQKWIDKSHSQVILYCIVFVCMCRFASTHKIKANNKNIIWYILYFYLCLLLIRIFIDFVLPDKGFFLYKTPETILFFFFCPILLPSLFFREYRFDFNLRKSLFTIGLLLSVCITSSLIDILSGNAVQNYDGRYQTAIFSIGFGQYSTTLMLIGCYLFKTIKNATKYRFFSLLYITIGLTGILFSGSRGPFVTVVICIAFYILSQMKNVRWVIILGALVMLIIPFLSDIIIALNEMMKSEGINAFDRVVESIFDDSGLTNHTSGRDVLYKEAWDLFIENPLFGRAYLIPGKIYAHNIIVEQFMATGIFGGLAFLIINIWAIVNGFKLMRKDARFAIIPLLYLQYFIYGCLSVTILALFPYWLFLLLTINKIDERSLYARRKIIGERCHSNLP